MESIKRLRKYANGPCVYKDQKRVLLEIAEAIEEEHAEAYAKAYDNSYDEGFASADDWLGQHEGEMAKHGWVKLPVDADGEVIRVGDMMKRERDGYMAEVAMLGLNVWGWYVNHGKYTPSELRHHHFPTVEDVLADMLKHFGAIEELTPEVSEYISESAAKVREVMDS